MINLQLLYQVLRYILQAIIIYLLLRYVPFIKLETNKAVIVTIILSILLIAIEYLCYWCMKPSVENFQSVQSGICTSCKVEPFGQKPQNEAPKCRIVCDGDKVKEGYEDTTQEIKPEERRVQSESTEDVPKKPDIVKNDMSREVEQENVRNFGGMYYDEWPFYNRYNNDDTKYSTDINQELNTHTDRAREQREIIDVNKARMAMDEQAHSTGGYETAYQEPGAKSQKRKGVDVGRRIERDLDNELPYSDFNMLPVGEGYKSHEYEYGYNFLPPEKWSVQWARPPVCVIDRKQNVCPVYTQGAPTDVKDFFSSSRITQPDQINTDYIKDKLNSGR